MQDLISASAPNRLVSAVAFLGRAIAGAVTLALGGAFLHGNTMEHSNAFTWLICAWALVGAFVGVFFGKTRLSGRAKWILLGIPFGLLIGIASAWVYAAINADTYGPLIVGKGFAGYINQAIILTLPAGVVFGMLVGWLVGEWRTSKCHKR